MAVQQPLGGRAQPLGGLGRQGVGVEVRQRRLAGSRDLLQCLLPRPRRPAPNLLRRKQRGHGLARLRRAAPDLPHGLQHGRRLDRQDADGDARLPTVVQAAPAHQPRSRQNSHKQPLQDVHRHRVADLPAQLRLGHGDLEVLWAHALQAHHLGLREPAPSVGDPVAAVAAACQTRSNVQDELHPRPGAVYVHDERLLQGVATDGADLLQRLQDVGVGVRLAGQGEVTVRRLYLPRLQEEFDAGPLHRLGPIERAVVVGLQDAYEVDAAAVLGNAVVLGVDDL
mmetsp:Transcript_50408/g.155888  ORF Transcript_50408/g.155888 Transcript_50408/m.155888 type:complete len:282 (+) Transcript_50408:345-1190(+)